MKRRIKLKGEIVLGIIISIIIGGVLSFGASKVYNEKFMDTSKLKSIASEKNKREVETLKYNLKSTNNIEDLGDSYVGKVFLVNRSGTVISPKENFGVKEFDISNKEETNLHIYGKKLFASNIIKLNENEYVVYLNEEYILNDGYIIRSWIIVSILCFLAFISGRIRYISYIAKSVREITTGNFSNKIKLKYKNELTYLAEDINYMGEVIQKEELNKREFITSISHDLRTPLTTILGYSKMLKEKVYSNEEELNRYISTIDNKAMYLKKMLDDFFDYSKLQSNEMYMEKNIINLNEITMQLLDEEEILFKENGLKLKVELENKTLHTYGDSALILRALSNLISNAIKYSKANTTVHIVTKEEVINEVSYGVFLIRNVPRDNIKENDIEKLFKRLYKIDKSRKEHGSGLGLPITQGIIKAHNGFINSKLSNGEIKFSIGLIKN